MGLKQKGWMCSLFCRWSEPKEMHAFKKSISWWRMSVLREEALVAYAFLVNDAILNRFSDRYIEEVLRKEIGADPKSPADTILPIPLSSDDYVRALKRLSQSSDREELMKILEQARAIFVDALQDSMSVVDIVEQLKEAHRQQGLDGLIEDVHFWLAPAR